MNVGVNEDLSVADCQWNLNNLILKQICINFEIHQKIPIDSTFIQHVQHLRNECGCE